MELQIKNMVCDRCIKEVKQILSNNNIANENVMLGKVSFEKKLNKTTFDKLELDLKKSGFALVEDKKEKLVVQIKAEILSFLQDEIQENTTLNLSEYLEQKLAFDYKSLAYYFKQIENQSIKNYYSKLKIEKVKELIEYNEMSLSQISDYLNFSSPAHLTKLFKNVAGYNPKEHDSNKNKRNQLDKI